MSTWTVQLTESLLSINVLTFSLLTVATVLVFYLLQHKKSIDVPLPPGPFGLPFVGYLPWLWKRNPFLHITELQDKFGSLISFYIGNRLVVVLGNYEVIKEAYVNQGRIFMEKPPHSPMEIDGNEKGISVSNGTLWKEQRQFVLKTLREFGVGKQSIEPAIKEEIFCFLQVLREVKGEPIDLRERLGASISNNICCLEFGKRFDYSDSNFLRIKRLLDSLTMNLDLIPMQMFFPWVKKIPGTNLFMNYGKLRRAKREIYKFITKIVQSHEMNFDTDEHRDVIFAWFDEGLDRTERKPDEDIFNRENLLFNLLSLFVAGSQTVTATLLAGVYYLTKYPHVQAKCRKEICDLIGNERLPSLSDRPFLPYVEATLLEIQRLISVNPLSLVHSTLEDTILKGFRIPKDTMIFSNQYAVHFDPKMWPEPSEFRPERFLNEKNQVVNQDKIIPFSIGKRSCLGISLAKMELFLYFTAYLQNFEFKPPSNEELRVEFVGGVVRTPGPFKIRAFSLETPIMKGSK